METEGVVVKGMEGVVTALNTGLTADTFYSVIADLMPVVIKLIPIALGLYFLRRLISGAGKAKVKF